MTKSALVSTAASAAAVIPFHCVICFDEFNLKMKYPVVLPCGHTYICNPCARRLKRCFECREPLFINAVLNKNSNHGHGHPSPNCGRGGPPLYPQRGYQSPPSPVPPAVVQHTAEPIALPLPKNLVLMSMMEAAESQTKIQEEEEDCIGSELALEGADTSSQADGDEDNDDDKYDSNMIISGLVTFSGPCGTYVVRDANGLAVQPNHPEKGSQSETEREHQSNFHEPFTIEQGQTVQVVNFSDGVAKVAREKGYIVASSSQLVKGEFWLVVIILFCGCVQIILLLLTSRYYSLVGAPLDRCCRLEGMIETLSLRGKDLQGALSENQHLEARLRTQVEKELEKDPDKPIISEAPRVEDETISESTVNPLEKAELPSDVQGYENPLLIPGSPREVIISETSDSSGLEMVGENRVLLYSDAANRLPSSPNSIDNSDFNGNAPGMPRYRRNNDDDLNEFGFGCGSSLFGKGFLNFEEAEQGVGLSFDSLDGNHPGQNNPRQAENTSSTRSFQGSVSSPSRPLQNQSNLTNFIAAASPMLSSSFDTVDWRTGMSGHRALSKSSPRATHVSRNVRLMSEHRGVGRAASRNSNSPSSSPATHPPQYVSPSDI